MVLADLRGLYHQKCHEVAYYVQCPMHYENANEGEAVQAGLYQLLIQHHRR